MISRQFSITAVFEYFTIFQKKTKKAAETPKQTGDH